MHGHFVMLCKFKIIIRFYRNWLFYTVYESYYWAVIHWHRAAACLIFLEMFLILSFLSSIASFPSSSFFLFSSLSVSFLPAFSSFFSSLLNIPHSLQQSNPWLWLSRFYLAADSTGELWISSDESETNLRKLVSITGWTDHNEWLKWVQQACQQVCSNAVILSSCTKFVTHNLLTSCWLATR